MSFGNLTMKPPHPQGLDSEPKPVGWATTVPQATGMRRRFQFTMESAQPCLDAGRFLMLMRQQHAKARQKRLIVPDLPANV
jgi:hypothetical protein